MGRELDPGLVSSRNCEGRVCIYLCPYLLHINVSSDISFISLARRAAPLSICASLIKMPQTKQFIENKALSATV